VVDTSVMIPLLPLRLEVDAGPSGDHVDDSAIRLIGEVFLFWCLGVILVVWVWVMWRQKRGWYNLYFLMVLICVVGWMLDVAIVVWLLVVVVCVSDNSLVVSWLCSSHSVPGGLCFRAIPCLVRAILAMKQVVKFARLLHPSPAPASRAIVVALGGIFLTANALADWVLVGYVVHLLLTAAIPFGVQLRRPCPGSAGLRRVLGLSLGLDLSLMELFGSGVLLEQLV
jgi:hypothetical protein